MKNENNKDTGKGIKNTLITIISVLMYIVYSLAKKTFEAIKDFNIKGIFAIMGGIFAIVIAIALLVLAITFWPLTLAIVATVAFIAIFFFNSDMLG